MKLYCQLGSLLFAALWLNMSLCRGRNMTSTPRQKSVGRMLRSVGNWPGVPISCFSCNIFYGTAGHYPSSFEDDKPASCVPNRGNCTQKTDCCWDASRCHAKKGICVGCLQGGEVFKEQQETLGCKRNFDCCGTGVCGTGEGSAKGVCYNPPPRCTGTGGGCTFVKDCCPGLKCKLNDEWSSEGPKYSCESS